jgi:hypothetical protein
MRSGRQDIVTTRTANGRLYSRRVAVVVGAVMTVISFALGYLIHPM